MKKEKNQGTKNVCITYLFFAFAFFLAMESPPMIFLNVP